MRGEADLIGNFPGNSRLGPLVEKKPGVEGENPDAAMGGGTSGHDAFVDEIVSADIQGEMHGRLDYELMQEYCNLFCGKRDFKNLSRTDKENTIRNIFDIKIRNFYPLLLIEITGESFLYNMVRCIVGNLILLTTGEITLYDAYRRHLIAPAQGLFLQEVYY